MKRTNRIISALLTLLLLLTAVGVYAAASESEPAAQAEIETSEKEAIKEGYFLFYDASADTFTECQNATFPSMLRSLDDGDSITLLSNIEVKKYGIQSKSGTSYLNLNGYRFSAYYDEQSRYFLQQSANSNLYIYSSA